MRGAVRRRARYGGEARSLPPATPRGRGGIRRSHWENGNCSPAPARRRVSGWNRLRFSRWNCSWHDLAIGGFRWAWLQDDPVGANPTGRPGYFYGALAPPPPRHCYAKSTCAVLWRKRHRGPKVTPGRLSTTYSLGLA